MPPLNSSSTGSSKASAYWRSLEEVADTPEFRTFLHREFPSGASELLDGTNRRSFLRIMGASMAMAGMGVAGCRRWPEEKIVPFAHRPEGTMPGEARHYASIVDLGGASTGVLVTSNDGRPTKMEGNTPHPDSLGAANAFTQASILDLYDPDRGRNVIDRLEHPEVPKASNWSDFDTWAATSFDAMTSTKGSGLWFLSEASSSPSVSRMQRAIRKRFPSATWVTFEPLENTASARGLDKAFGGSWRAMHDLTHADVIVSFDCDFLGQHPEELRLSKQWATNRRPSTDHGKPTISRVYLAEPTLTVTGCSADERYPLRPESITALAARVAAEVTGNDAIAAPFESIQIDPAMVSTIVKDLKAHAGQSVVMAGPRQPRFVHHLCALINETLGNAGKTVSYVKLPAASMKNGSLSGLTEAMAAGSVDTLVIIGGNPAYDAPADLDFAGKLAKVKNSIHLSRDDNETSQLCRWHLNRAHALECWGDGRGWGGTYAVCQPLILPLFEGRSPIELLAMIAGEKTRDGFDIVRMTEMEIAGAQGALEAFSPRWRELLHEGMLQGSAFLAESPKVNAGSIARGAEVTAKSSATGSSAVAVFAGDYSVYDGRFANNGWLQELPDPITKLTWDNAVIMGPSQATALGIRTGDMVRVTVGSQSVEAAALVETGQAAGVITLPLGYGRRFEGRVCFEAGFDFYPLRSSDAMWSAPASVEKIDGSYVLARTQNHWAIDTVAGQGIEERLPTLFREADLTTYQSNPHFAGNLGHTMHSLSLWDDELQFEGARFKWGMSIDLSTCTGCGACVVACQAENNIPIVGKDQVRMGREMSWLRIDRYYRFSQDAAGKYDIDNPQSVAIQPMACQHCENAPCEQVCPVAATVHSTDGLNVMVYNRCVGTRYCSNNCPYKVRRFNFFDYFRRDPLRETGLLQVQPSYYIRRQSGGDPLRRMQFNPEVTVRMRGIMEKCSYCTQRLEAAKIKAKNAWVKKPEAEKAKGIRLTVSEKAVMPACAQTCATEAIIFGDLMDEKSRVAKAQANERSYEVLGELNVKTRTRYLARVYNAVDGERHPEAFHGHGGHSKHESNDHGRQHTAADGQRG